MLMADIATKIVIPWAPLLLLGIWAAAADVGQYAMASRVAMLASFLLIAVNTAVAPKFASMFRQGEFVQLEKVARHSTIMLTAVAAPLTLFIILFAEKIMGVFGSEFQVGADILVILSLGQFVNAACGSVGYLLAMSGNELLYQRITVGTMLLLLGLALVLIPEMGSLGAAIAVAVTVAIQNILLAWAVYRRLKISVFWFIRGRQYESI
jgi:O-antigen/teichoic acid export membrane protein